MANERITGKFLLNKLLLAFDFDTGFLLTIKELTIRPGTAIRRYIEGDRRIYDPIKFLTIVFVLTFFSASLLDSFDTSALNYGYFDNESKTSFYVGATAAIILASVFFNLLFKKKYNFYETIALFTYITGYFIFILVFFKSLIGSILFIITKNDYFIDFKIHSVIPSSFLIIYFFWVLKSFYQKNYIKTTFLVLLFIGCIILSNEVDIYIKSLIKTDNPSRVGILFSVKENDSNMFKSTKNNTSFLVVDSIYANSGAEKAGLKKGDALLKINGKRTSIAIFNKQIQKYQLGETVLIEILREGNTMYMPVTLKHKDSLLMD